MSAAKLCTEADVIRTLRAGTYTLAELYALSEAGSDTSRANGHDPVDNDRHPHDRRWKRRVRGALQQLRVKGDARRIDRAVWALHGTVARPRRMLLIVDGAVEDFELRVESALTLLATLDAPCDLLVTDPPYALGLGQGSRSAERYARDASQVIPGYVDVAPDRYAAFTRDWVEAAAEVLRPGGQLAVVTGPQQAPIVHLCAERAGLSWVSTIAARKAFPLRTLRRPACAHWNVTVMTRGCVDDPARVFNLPTDLPLSRSGTPYPLDVWLDNGRADRPGQLRNETELPYRFLRRIVAMFSNEGEHVVDPYLGGGNLARACRALGRPFTGGDCNPHAIQLAGARLLEETLWPSHGCFVADSAAGFKHSQTSLFEV